MTPEQTSESTQSIVHGSTTDGIGRPPPSRKTSFAIAGALILVVGILFAISIANRFLGSRGLSGYNIALQSAQFLEKTLQGDGSFELAYLCKSGEDVCSPIDVEGPRHTGQAILAFYELYKETGDVVFKEKADHAMRYVLEQCTINKDFCEWNFFPLYVYYKETGDRRYLDGMLLSSKHLVAEENLSTFLSTNAGVKMRMLYDVTKDVAYIDKLTSMTSRLLSGEPLVNNLVILNVDGVVIRAQDIQAAWSLLIPTYEVTRDPALLGIIEETFERNNYTAHLDVYDAQPSGTADLTKGTETLLTLATFNEEKSDFSNREAQTIGEHLLKTRWDNPEMPKFTGDYGFLTAYDASSGKKDTLFNGWLIQLFLKMKDASFLNN